MEEVFTFQIENKGAGKVFECFLSIGGKIKKDREACFVAYEDGTIGIKMRKNKLNAKTLLHEVLHMAIHVTRSHNIQNMTRDEEEVFAEIVSELYVLLREKLIERYGEKWQDC